MEDALRCPECGALVVDRRLPACGTCHAALPAGWVFTPEQAAKIEMLDQHARAEHAQVMEDLDPAHDPNDMTQLNPDSLPG